VAKHHQHPSEDSVLGLPRLLRGRYGLSRRFLTQNPRDRLTAGIIAAVAERGYHEVTIAQITAAGGVSRRTFYAYFPSKQECFFATYDMVADHLSGLAAAAAAPFSDWPDRLAARFRVVLDAFAANPDLARFVLIAPPRAGGEITARFHLAINNALLELTEEMPPPPAVRVPSDAVQRSLPGGIVALIVGRVEAGEGEQLPELLPDLLELTLARFLPLEEALRVARQAAT
jgi:AcrR family transcriptional regulator